MFDIKTIHKNRVHDASSNDAQCPSCGARYTSIDQVRPIRSLGLSLWGTCPACGGIKVPAERLWHVKKVAR